MISSPIDRSALRLGAGVFILIGLAAALVFLNWPEIDLRVAGHFADGTDGFALRHHPVPKFFNELINIAALVVALWCLGGWIMARRMRMAVAGLWSRHYGFLLVSLITGPGLVANALFKENWGRARPRQITEFGGTADFSPPLLIADQCQTNCSFVSGDASMGFFFLAVAMLAPPAFRRVSIACALTFGAFIGFMRIIQGAHFLSDVIFAGVFVGLVILALYAALIRPWTPPLHGPPKPLLVQLGLKRNSDTRPRAQRRSAAFMIFRARPDDLQVPAARSQDGSP